MKKRWRKHTPLLVLWEDIVSDSKWADPQDHDTARTMSVCTIGWVLSCRKNELVLGHSLCEDGQADTMVIPWGVIKDVEELYSDGSDRESKVTV